MAENEAPVRLEPQDGPQGLLPTGTKDGAPEPPMRRGISFGHRWAVSRPKALARDRKPSRRRSKDVASLSVVTVEPSWGDQRVFQHYRARLRELYDSGTATTEMVARFRETNRAIETRLRQRMPHLIAQIDALYAETKRHDR